MSTPYSNYEKETIINFNMAENTASLYTLDPFIIRKMDKLVEEHPDQFKLVEEQNDGSKTCQLPTT